MLWAERTASEKMHDEIRRHRYDIRTCSHPMWRAQEAAGWRSPSVSWRGRGESTQGEGTAVPQHPVWAKPAQRSSREGCGVGGRNALPGWGVFRRGGKTGSDTEGLNPVPCP